MSTAAVAVPTTAEERYAFLDVLRGFALLGILVINLGSYSLYWAVPAEQRAALPTAGFDSVADVVRGLLFEGKFYSIFSLLFGIGFAIQLLRRGRAVDAVLPTYRRRLLVLAAIGAVHMQLLWSGDILLLYALLGFLLLPFRDRSDRALLSWAVALLLLPVLLQAAVAATGGAANPGAPFRQLAQRIDTYLGYGEETDWAALVVNGGWREFFIFNLPGPLYRVADLLGSHRLPKVLAMFLVGFWAGRRLRLGELETHRRLLRHVLVWGLLLGAIGNPVMVWLSDDAFEPTARGVAHAAAYTVGVAPLGLAWAAGLALLYLRPRWRTGLDHFAPAGRMALTNYIGQSVLCVALFYGPGLGLGGRVGPALYFPIAAAIFALQILTSRWWLARFRFGPLEWLWRSLTYGRLQPLARTHTAADATVRS